MSSDTSCITVLEIKGKVAKLRVRSIDAPETNGYSCSRSFALQLLIEAWTRAADEGFEAPETPRPIDLEMAKKGEWWTEAFMKKNVAKFIARTKILSRVNMCDGSREARDELCRISDKYETTSSLKRETEYAKAYHYVILEVTVTDAKWLKGLEANLVFCSTAYDVWSDDPLFPKAPPGTPWVFKGKPKSKTKSGYLDETFQAALDHRDSKAARALIKNIDPEARYLIRDDVHDDFDIASQMMGFARKPVIETTAFLYALKSCCDDIAFELLKLGADPLAIDGNGSTALFLTSEEKTFTKLVKTGIDINAKNLGGRTVLHVATLWGWTEIADLAIEHGADTTLKDKGGKTPADLAKQSDDPPKPKKRTARSRDSRISAG